MERIKTWEELTISDNFIFQHVMQNAEICKMFLEKLLHIKIKNITYPELEKNLDLGLVSKGIRLDVFTEDERGDVYDIEMQTTNSPRDDLPKRTRYYQSLIDANILNKGEDYSALKNSFVIFVCTFDPFGENRRMYTFKNFSCESPNLLLGDGATKIFLNAGGNFGDVDEDIKNLLDYISGGGAQGFFTERVSAETDKVKRRDRLRVEYMTFTAELMRTKRIAKEEGREEGRLEERFSMVKNLLYANTPIECIIKATGWTKEQILAAAQYKGDEAVTG